MPMRCLLAALLVAACAPAQETPDAGGTTPTTDAGDTTPDAGEATADAGDTSPDAGPTVEPWVPAKYTTFNASGTRLKARAVTDANGNSAVTWFDDTALGVRCTVRTVEGGRRFCLPEAIDVEAMGNVVYLDSNCTELALRVPTGCDDRKYAAWRNFTYYKTGPSTAVDVYAAGGFGCSATSVPAGQEIVTLTTVSDFAAEFVEFPEANDTVHPVDASVGVRVLASADGAKLGDTLVNRASGRPAHPIEVSAGNVRLVEKNPFQVPFSYERYSCDVSDHRYADSFVAPIVDPVPAYVQVTILPPSYTPGSSTFLKIRTTQETYCNASGQTLTAPAGYRVYVLGTAADLSVLPVLKKKAGAGPGTNLAHWLTADDVPAIPTTALDLRAELDLSGTAVSLSMLGGAPVGIPVKSLGLVGGSLYTDAQCTTPAAPADTYAVGDLLAYLGDVGLGAGSCKETLLNSPRPLESLWRVKDEAPTNGFPYNFRSMGGPLLQCVSMNQSMGGPPPPPISYRSTTDVTGQASTLLSTVSSTVL